MLRFECRELTHGSNGVFAPAAEDLTAEQREAGNGRRMHVGTLGPIGTGAGSKVFTGGLGSGSVSGIHHAILRFPALP